ncbi:MAG: transposase [Gammaproteobacteria bacterium]|nr:transposase [Gammaproteobacteria bacterium]
MLVQAGHCWDNAYMESFYHTLKTEMVYFMKFRCLAEAIAHIMDYIRYYNQTRRHSVIGYISPNEYEQKHKQLTVSTFCR